MVETPNNFNTKSGNETFIADIKIDVDPITMELIKTQGNDRGRCDYLSKNCNIMHLDITMKTEKGKYSAVPSFYKPLGH